MMMKPSPLTLPYVAAGLTAIVALSGFLGFIIIDPSSRFRYWLIGFEGMGSFVLIAAIAVAASVLLHHLRFKCSSWASVLPIALCLTIFIGGPALISVLMQIAAAALVGFALLSRLWNATQSDPASQSDALALGLLSTLSGLAIFSTLLWGMSHFPINYSGVHALLYVSLSIAALLMIRVEDWRLLGELRRFSINAKPDWRLSLLIAPGLVACLTLLFMTALPEFGSDARAAYQSFFEQMRFNARWHHDPALAAWGLQPLGGLHLAGSVYLLGGESASRLQNAMMMLLSLGGAAMTAGLVSRTRLGAAACFSIVATIPLLLELTSEFYYDNTVAAFVMGAVLSMLCLLKTRSSDHATPFLVALAICLAGASATKHTSWLLTIVFGGLCAVLIMLRHDRPVRSICVLLGTGIVSFAALVLPIATFAYVTSGNPVFPYYNQIFQSPFYPPEQHSTPHTGYVGWDVMFRAVFDTNTFSSSDFRGGFGLAILLSIPAILTAAFVKKARLAMTLCVGLALLFVGLSAMQNDLRLLWPVSLAVMALSTGLLSQWIETPGWASRLFIASVVSISAIQLLLMPAGGHGVPSVNVSQALSPKAADSLYRRRAPTAAINAMLDNLPDRTERRLFLSTLMGPQSATGVEDGWYTYLARLRLHRSNSEDAMLDTLQTLSPDAIILGTRGHRRWLNSSIYELVNRHARAVIDYPGHQVFLMDNLIAFPVIPEQPEDSQALFDQASGAELITGAERLVFNFLTQDTSIERFQVQFSAQCEIQEILQIVVAVRAPGRLHEYTLTERPCQGEATPFQTTASAFMPQGSTRVTVEIKTRSRDTEFSVSELSAGFKSRFDRNAALEL
ncbi:hypothetical protein [Oceanicaulis alexandrii]|uniref:hypothetical protein n=1 Tax=Oceanicaulis alexandrii TaxID=153233 RepID=UPI0035CEF35A